jgi:hypothetical protein
MQLNVTVGDMISWIFSLNIASQGHQRRRKVVEGGPLDHLLSVYLVWVSDWIELTSHHNTHQW